MKNKYTSRKSNLVIILALLMSLILALSVFTGCDDTSESDTRIDAPVRGFSSGLAYSSNNDGTCSVVGIGSCTDSDLRIPPIAPDIGDRVTSIGSSAFKYCSALTSITIGNSVTSIGNRAFEGCSGLTSITIPQGVTSIGDYAFSHCTGLTSITIPDNVTSIGGSAFYGCTKLREKENGVSYVDKWVIDCDTSITSISLRNNTVGIGSSAFEYCSALTSITIPDSVTSIGREAFENCTNLIEKENGVSYVDKWVIDCDTSITSVSLRNNTVGIGYAAFSGCTNLTDITIPQSVANIGKYAFSGCTNMAHEENDASSDPARLKIKKYHGMDADCPYTLTFTPNGDGTCTLTRVDVNLLYTKPITLTIPSVSPAGDRVTCIDTDSLTLIPLFVEDSDFRSMMEPMKEALGEDNFYYRLLLSYYGGADGVMSQKSQATESLMKELHSIYPITDKVDLWVLDSSSLPSKRTRMSELLYAYCPQFNAVTVYSYLLNLQAVADAYDLRMPMELSDFNAGGMNIEVIELPDTLERVNDGGLAGCLSLKEIRTSMSEAAFRKIIWENREGDSQILDNKCLDLILSTDSSYSSSKSVHIVCSDSSFDLTPSEK